MGPLTVTLDPATATSTPAGTGTGILPIRLISPHLTHDLATEAAPACLTIGEQTLRGGYDDHP